MQASKRFGLILVVSLLTILPLGCSTPQQQTGVIQPDTSLSGSSRRRPEPERGSPAESGDQWDSSIVKRFQDASPQSRTAVESAMELLEKHAELAKQAAELEKRNHSLIAENSQFKSQVSSLEADLKQTQKELTEANDLLVEMRIELNNWKTSILGFRDEMRQADIAQLETLLKILKILGGEVTVQSAQGRQSDDRSPTSASARQPGQLAPASPDASQGGGVKVQETRAPGENNG